MFVLLIFLFLQAKAHFVFGNLCDLHQDSKDCDIFKLSEIFLKLKQFPVISPSPPTQKKELPNLSPKSHLQKALRWYALPNMSSWTYIKFTSQDLLRHNIFQL